MVINCSFYSKYLQFWLNCQADTRFHICVLKEKLIEKKYFSRLSWIRWNTTSWISWSIRRRNKKTERASPHCWNRELFTKHQACSAAMGGRASFSRDWDANMWSIFWRISVESRKWARRYWKKPREYHITLWR